MHTAPSQRTCPLHRLCQHDAHQWYEHHSSSHHHRFRKPSCQRRMHHPRHIYVAFESECTSSFLQRQHLVVCADRSFSRLWRHEVYFLSKLMFVLCNMYGSSRFSSSTSFRSDTVTLFLCTKFASIASTIPSPAYYMTLAAWVVTFALHEPVMGLYSSDIETVERTRGNASWSVFDVSEDNGFQNDSIICSTPHCKVICDTYLGCGSSTIDASSAEALIVECSGFQGCFNQAIRLGAATNVSISCVNSPQPRSCEQLGVYMPYGHSGSFSIYCETRWACVGASRYTCVEIGTDELECASPISLIGSDTVQCVATIT